MTVKAARKLALQLRLTRAGCCASVAALLIFFGSESLQNATAEGDTRTISFHHIHTNENLTITYKVNGRYDDAALAKINHVLRDWRENQPIEMDPHVIDVLWEVHREVGAKEPISVVCGYRSPATNSSLRKRSSGVAKHSQHMQGKAIDFFIPGVPLEEVRAAGLRAQRGGVGFYPSSGFVHLDTGGVRHWPRMPDAQLAKILSKGQLASHFASDTKGTAIARAESARPGAMPSFLANLFGTKNEEQETTAPARASSAAASGKPEPKPQKPAQIAASGAETGNLVSVPLPTARPAKPQVYQVASADTKIVMPAEVKAEVVSSFAEATTAGSTTSPVRLAQVTTVPANDQNASDVINARGFWKGSPGAEPVEVAPSKPERVPAAPAPAARRPTTNNESKTSAAAATPWPSGSREDPLPNALSYAAQPTPIATARPLPMGTMTRRPHTETTVVAKQSEERVPSGTTKIEAPVTEPVGKVAKIGGAVRVGDRFDDPWMRAMILSPSAQSYMKTTLFGSPDFRNLGSYLHKPATALPLGFTTQDPYLGMSSEKFSGNAVMFLSSISVTSRTATR